MSDPYLFPPIFSWPAAPGGQLFTYYAGGTVFAPTFAASGAVNTNPVILDANGSASVRRDPDISYHFVLMDSTGQTTIWDADQFPADAIFGAPTTIAAGTVVDIGTSAAHAALIHGAGATITSFGTSANPGTPFYLATFDGANTLVNSSTLVLPGGANIATATGDAILAQYTGVGWNVLFYQQGFVSGTVAEGFAVDQAIYKKASQTIQSSTVLQIDSDLVSQALQPGTYSYELVLNFYSNNGTNGGIHLEVRQNGLILTTPVLYIAYSVNGSGTVSGWNPLVGHKFSAGTLSNGFAQVPAFDTLIMRGTFAVATAGPLQIWWAQNSSSTGNVTVPGGSFLWVRSATAS